MASLRGITEIEESADSQDHAPSAAPPRQVYRDERKPRRMEDVTLGEERPRIIGGAESSQPQGVTAWLLNVTIGKRLMLSFGALIFLLVCVAAAGYVGTKKISSEMMALLQTDARMEQLYTSGLLNTIE